MPCLSRGPNCCLSQKQCSISAALLPPPCFTLSVWFSCNIPSFSGRVFVYLHYETTSTPRSSSWEGHLADSFSINFAVSQNFTCGSLFISTSLVCCEHYYLPPSPSLLLGSSHTLVTRTVNPAELCTTCAEEHLV